MPTETSVDHRVLTLTFAFLLVACGGTQSSESTAPAVDMEATTRTSGDSNSAQMDDSSTSETSPAPPSDEQLAALVQQETQVYNMVAPMLKAYTMADSAMTPETIAPRRHALVAWGTRLAQFGGEIQPIFPELGEVTRGSDTPSPEFVQQEAASYNMVAALLKAYTMADSTMTPETIAPRRQKLVAWGLHLKSLGGSIDAVFPELQ